MFITGGQGYRGSKISTIEVYSSAETLVRALLRDRLEEGPDEEELDRTVAEWLEYIGRVYWVEADPEKIDHAPLNTKLGKNQLRDRIEEGGVNLNLTLREFAANPSLLVHAPVAAVA